MKAVMTIGLVAAFVVAPTAFAQTSSPATPTERIGTASPVPAAKKLSVDSTLKELLDDARARKVIVANTPLIVEHAPSYPEILTMTFRALSAVPEAQAQGGLSPEAFKIIEAQLAAL